MGLVLFAAILLFVVGVFNLIWGIAAIFNSHFFTTHAHYVIGDLRAWGWVTLILAILQLGAAGGILVGNQWARWFAVAVVGLNAIAMMLALAGLPGLGGHRHRRGHSGAVRAVCLRQPPEPGRHLTNPQCRTGRDLEQARP